MNQSQALLLFGVTDLALGLAFLYLWRYILPRRYAILLAVARGWAVLEAVTLLLQIRYPAAAGLGAAARLFSAAQTVCYIAGLYDLVRRRAPWVPLAALGVLLAAWGIGGSRWSSDFLWLTLPNSLVLTIAYVGIAWVLFHGPTTPGRRPLAVMLVIAGLHNLDYPWLATLPWGYSFGLVVALFNALAISALLLIVLVEEARREATVADAARQESEGRYRAIFDFAPVGVAVVDPEGRYVQTNPAFERLLGFSKSELQGHHFREFTATEDLDPTVHVFERMVAGGRDYFQIEKRYRRKDGATVWGHLSVAAVRDAQGALLHTVSLIEDVSDAKRHEAEARHAEEGVRKQQTALVDLAKQPVLYAGDAQAAWRVLTESAARTLGVERVGIWLHASDRASITCVDLFERGAGRHSNGLGIAVKDYPDYFRALEQDRTIAAVDARRDPRTHEFADGFLIPHGVASLLDAPIRVAGDIVGVVSHEHVGTPRTWTPADQAFAGSVADLAALALGAGERARAQEALRESEERYRAAFEQAAVGLAEIGLDGRFLRVNRRLCELLGYEPTELLQRTLVDVTHPDDVAPDRKFMHDALAGSAYEQRRETRFRRKSGTIVWAYITTTLVRGGGGKGEAEKGNGVPRHFFSVIEDKTERKSLEEQLLQAQKMDAIGRLAGGVAHDFNNLLSAMLGYAQILQGSLGRGDPRQEDLEEIRRAGHRAADLTRQLLAFARKQVIEPRSIDLNDLVVKMEKLLRRLIGADIDLHTKLAPELEAVRVDPGQFEQVVMNLVVNGRDAMPGGGRLTIETSNVRLDEQYARQHAGVQPGRYVMVAVSDTGTGMDPETQARAFEPFFTTKPAGHGTGLGLSTCYGIVKQAGGDIRVYSEPGQGSTFRVYLPSVTTASETTGTTDVEVALPMGTETVLLVEDETQVRAIVTRMLTGQGYRVLAAANGEEALALSRRHGEEIDLLLTDVVLPRMNGRQLVERLRAEQTDRLEPLRVLYVSGYTEETIAHRGVLEAGVEYLPKPLTLEVLARRVRSVLDAPR